MKRKLLLLCFALLLGVVMVGCNDTNTTTTTTGSTATTTLERLATPTGLTVTGTVLSWTAVPNAAQYAIYVNDALQTTVTGTNYDFASLTGTQLLFRVVAKAASGGSYADSLMSASAAYVANATAEINAINALMTDFMTGAPEGFAEELVRKGMTAEEFGNFKTAMNSFMDTMETNPDATGTNQALATLLATDVNTEALFGGLLLMQREMLASSIDELEAGKVACQETIDLYGNDWYCEMPISSYDSEIAMQTAMQEMVTTEADRIALVAANTLDYIELLQTHVTGTLLTDIESLINSNDAPTAEELLTIKNEIVAILLENMPPVEDLDLLFELLGGMVTSLEGGSALGNEIATLSGPLSTMSRASLHLYLKFFDGLDLTFFTDLKSTIETTESEEAMQLEIQILFLKAFHAFENANPALFTAVSDAMTDIEQQDLYEAFAASLPDLMAGMIEDETFDPGAVEQVFVALTWPIVSGFSDVESKVSGIVLDHYVATDFAALRKQMLLSMFDYDYWEESYFNRLTGTVYANETEYNYAQKVASTEMLEANVALAKAVLDGTDQADFDKVADFILAVLPVDQMLLSFEYAGTYEATDFMTVLRATVEDQSDEFHGLLEDFVNYLVANDVFEELRGVFADVHASYLTNVGPDYMAGYYDDTLETQAIAIFAAKHLDGFLTTMRETTLKGIATEVFDLLDTAPYRDLLGFTTEQIETLRTDFTTMVDDALAKAAIIRDYDALTLSEAQIAAVDDFISVFQGAN
jgi:hypothetical protein